MQQIEVQYGEIQPFHDQIYPENRKTWAYLGLSWNGVPMAPHVWSLETW